MSQNGYKIDPDGVEINIAWEQFSVGSSVFIPCINTRKAKKQVENFVSSMDMQIRAVARSENNKWGIRIWRLM